MMITRRNSQGYLIEIASNCLTLSRVTSVTAHRAHCFGACHTRRLRWPSSLALLLERRRDLVEAEDLYCRDLNLVHRPVSHSAARRPHRPIGPAFAIEHIGREAFLHAVLRHPLRCRLDVRREFGTLMTRAHSGGGFGRRSRTCPQACR